MGSTYNFSRTFKKELNSYAVWKWWAEAIISKPRELRFQRVFSFENCKEIQILTFSSICRGKLDSMLNMRIKKHYHHHNFPVTRGMIRSPTRWYCIEVWLFNLNQINFLWILYQSISMNTCDAVGTLLSWVQYRNNKHGP